MNPFKKWLRICLAGVIVILEVAHCPRLFCVFLLLFVLLKNLSIIL